MGCHFTRWSPLYHGHLFMLANVVDTFRGETYLAVDGIGQLLALSIPTQTVMILLLTRSIGPWTLPTRFVIANPSCSRQSDILYPPDKNMFVGSSRKKHAVWREGECNYCRLHSHEAFCLSLRTCVPDINYPVIPGRCQQTLRVGIED